MSKEAMKLALEALEWCHGGEPCGTAEAITALREALAEQPAQQEPVATVTSESQNPNVSMSWWHEPALPVGTLLYTSQPAQRTWVGLTDEERNHARQSVTYSQLAMTASEWTEAVQIETERRLREKNNA